MLNTQRLRLPLRSTDTALRGWSAPEWFEPAELGPLPDVFAEVDGYLSDVDIGSHPFFAIAEASEDALRVWVGQELVVTGPVSQMLLALAASIDNVHIRSRVACVAWGEHSKPVRGVAKRAHPWLLYQLSDAVGLQTGSLEPLPETAEFLEAIEGLCDSLIAAIAAIGESNERLIIPEYERIKECFAAAMPDVSYSTFLDANIKEDTFHTQLLREAAALVIQSGAAEGAYFDAAKASIDARLRYYDRLTCRLNRR